MRPNNHILNAGRATPLMTRLTILVRSVTEGERPQVAVGKLIELVGLMASFLNAEQRLAVAQHLRDEADTLAPLEQRALN